MKFIDRRRRSCRGGFAPALAQAVIEIRLCAVLPERKLQNLDLVIHTPMAATIGNNWQNSNGSIERHRKRVIMRCTGDAPELQGRDTNRR